MEEVKEAPDSESVKVEMADLRVRSGVDRGRTLSGSRTYMSLFHSSPSATPGVFSRHRHGGSLGEHSRYSRDSICMAADPGELVFSPHSEPPHAGGIRGWGKGAACGSTNWRRAGKDEQSDCGKST